MRKGMIRVVAGVWRHRGRFLLAERICENGTSGWEFPGGKVEEGESDEAALFRELQEELGLSVSVGCCLGTERLTIRKRAALLLFYEVTARRRDLHPREGQAVKWLFPCALSCCELLEADRRFASKYMDKVRGSGEYKRH